MSDEKTAMLRLVDGLLWIVLWCVVVSGIFQVATLRTVTRIEESLQGIAEVQVEPGKTGDE